MTARQDLPERPCAWCGETFKPTRKWQKYCPDKPKRCKDKANGRIAGGTGRNRRSPAEIDRALRLLDAIERRISKAPSLERLYGRILADDD